MTKHKYVISVPKPQPNAYNPDRPVSDLVRNQIFHLSVAERHLAKRHRSGIDIHSIKTEQQASEYIHHLTKKLHPEGALKSRPTKKGRRSSKKSAAKKRKARSKRN